MVVRRQDCQAPRSGPVDARAAHEYSARVPNSRKVEKPKQKKQARKPTPDAMRGFPERLTEAVRDSGQTDAAIAEASGVDAGGISRWKRGQRYAGIDAATVVRLAAALDVRVGWLLAGETPKTAGALPAVLIEDPAQLSQVGDALIRYLEKHGVAKFALHKGAAPDDDTE